MNRRRRQGEPLYSVSYQEISLSSLHYYILLGVYYQQIINITLIYTFTKHNNKGTNCGRRWTHCGKINYNFIIFYQKYSEFLEYSHNITSSLDNFFVSRYCLINCHNALFIEREREVKAFKSLPFIRITQLLVRLIAVTIANNNYLSVLLHLGKFILHRHLLLYLHAHQCNNNNRWFTAIIPEAKLNLALCTLPGFCTRHSSIWAIFVVRSVKTFIATWHGTGSQSVCSSTASQQSSQ